MGMRTENARPVSEPGGPSRTKQAFKDEADINQIMARYKKTGMVTHLASGHPVYADVSQFGDFREVYEYVQSVNEFFVGMPADVREAFENDPRQFLEYMNDPGRTEEELEEMAIHIMDREDELVDVTPDEDRVEEPGGSGEGPNPSDSPDEA